MEETTTVSQFTSATLMIKSKINAYIIKMNIKNK